MEIGPIPGIRVLPVRKVAPPEQKLSAFFDIEALARPEGDTWSGDSRNAAGGQDDEPDELNSANEAEQSDDPRRANYFA